MKWLKHKIGTTWIYLAVMVYLIFAFGWWAYLLIENNDKELIFHKTQLARELQLDVNDKKLLTHPEYLTLRSDYQSKKTMVISEGLVFVITLSFGLYLLIRSYRRELDYRTQQKNFLLSITHELRSPLASIQLAMETLKKRKLDQSQQDDLLKSALLENTRLNTLVNDILLATRMEEMYDPVLERTDIKKLFDDLITSMRYKFPNIQWKIHSELKETMVIVDRIGLTSILVNLMENAAKYSDKEGEVRIVYHEYNNNILIKIVDSGIGIPDEEKKRIFEKFYRVGDEAVRKTTGTGLGLYLVKKLVDSYGGLLTVHDNHPKGTIFDISLPINLPATKF